MCKRVSPEWDWISRATGDRGRALSMWRAGVFDRLPDRVEHATVAVEPAPDGVGWDVFMKDVSAELVGPEQRLDRQQVRTGDDAARARAVVELEWWSARVREAFDTWSPS